MTQPIPKQSLTPLTENRRLNLHDVYICPVCRYGELSVLTLTESFACNFCRHIFTTNLNDQLLIMADSSQPMAWRWTGRNWKIAHQKDSELTAVLWLLGAALVIFPTLIVGLSAYIFPAEEGSYGAWLPKFWIGLTFVCHLSFVVWLLAENYQLPYYMVLKVKLREFLSRREERT
ncbi:hypothetical protein [Aerosakkonema funiforme]|uniref:Uncharacterized protein n=2 Tax=Oscillatoriophycideae TaxID=1301283 RepID=A0A926VN28_9CYAN|nr:hypothetical protein [Aerosakkonema funiforme]MBD2185862.1 hypothetical protein [Aerosakkonema funiforme FACHB-1375]